MSQLDVDKMVYRLGVVGLGHWFEMIHRGLSKNNEVVLSKVVGTRKFSDKAEELRKLNISESNYFCIGEDPFIIPSGFFSSLDVMQISNPNKYHSSQTKQGLEEGLYVITEKTLATNKAEFDDLINFVKSGGYEEKVYLHLHYMHKLLTLNLPAMLEKIIPSHGKINSFSATFFEEANEADRMRSSWIFSPESGGIFMDWIHPYEILLFGAKAQKISLSKINTFIVNPEYDSKNPTGIESFVNVQGNNFTTNAKGVIRISKGLPHEAGLKRFVFSFESGSKLYLNFVGSQIEFNSDSRGSWQLVNEDHDQCRILDSGIPRGPATSELLVDDIIKLCKGGGPFIKIDDIIRIFEPQWDYQRMTKSQESIRDQNQIEMFMRNGLSGRM